MPLFETGTTVYATREITTPATGDHPTFYHATRGDKLYVIDYQKGAEYPYRVAHTPSGDQAFWVSSKELMGQKPFNHN